MTNTDPSAEVTGEFEVTQWDQTPYGDEAHGPALARATVRKTFRGDIDGISVAEVLLAGAEGGRGYLASEVFTGVIAGRRGTVVFQHGGIDDGADPFTYGSIVPGTGTEELAGLAGAVAYAHDETGARVTLTLRP